MEAPWDSKPASSIIARSLGKRTVKAQLDKIHEYLRRRN
jgi:hypothetical protein